MFPLLNLQSLSPAYRLVPGPNCCCCWQHPQFSCRPGHKPPCHKCSSQGGSRGRRSSRSWGSGSCQYLPSWSPGEFGPPVALHRSWNVNTSGKLYSNIILLLIPLLEDLSKSTYSLSIEIKVHGKGYDWHGHNGHKYGNIDQGIHKIVITIN